MSQILACSAGGVMPSVTNVRSIGKERHLVIARRLSACLTHTLTNSACHIGWPRTKIPAGFESVRSQPQRLIERNADDILFRRVRCRNGDRATFVFPRTFSRSNTSVWASCAACEQVETSRLKALALSLPTILCWWCNSFTKEKSHRQDANAQNIKKSAIYYDKTQHANVRGNPLFQATQKRLNNS